MADTIYEVPVGTAGSVNLGYIGADQKEYRTRALIVTPLDFRIPPDVWQDNDALLKYLQDAAQNDDSEKRIQIIDDIQGAEPDNKEATPLSFAYGPDQRVYGDETATNYTRGNTGLVSHQLLQQLNDYGANRLYIRWDEKRQLNGTALGDGVFKGFSASEFFAAYIAGDTGNGVAQTFRIAWGDPAENNFGNKLILPTRIAPNSITNVMSIHLKQIANLNSSRVVVIAFMGGNINNPYNLAQSQAYRTILVNTPNLVNFRTAAGVALTITSAAPAFINGQNGVAYTIASTGYPVAGQKLYVDMDAVSVNKTALGTPVETPEQLVLTVA